MSKTKIWIHRTKKQIKLCNVHREQSATGTEMGGKQKRWTKSAKLCQFIGVSVNFYSSHFIICAHFFTSGFCGSGGSRFDVFLCAAIGTHQTEIECLEICAHCIRWRLQWKKRPFFLSLKWVKFGFQMFCRRRKKRMNDQTQCTHTLYISSVAVNKMSKWEMNGQSCWPKSNFASIKYFCDEVNIFAWHEIAWKWQPK